jgi:hypothetical protein
MSGSDDFSVWDGWSERGWAFSPSLESDTHQPQFAKVMGSAKGSIHPYGLRRPHRLLSPTEFAKFSRPQMCLIFREELVQLRRLDGCRGKHAVCLPPMMDLVLKQMHQETIAPFVLYPRISIDLHHFVETVRGQTLADLDETPINCGLLESKIGNRRARYRVLPRFRPKPPAFERVNVEPVNNQDMIAGFLQA